MKSATAVPTAQNERTYPLELTQEQMKVAIWAQRTGAVQPGEQKQTARVAGSDRRRAARIVRQFQALLSEIPDSNGVQEVAAGTLQLTLDEARYFLRKVIGPHEEVGWPAGNIVAADEMVEAWTAFVTKLEAEQHRPKLVPTPAAAGSPSA